VKPTARPMPTAMPRWPTKPPKQLSYSSHKKPGPERPGFCSGCTRHFEYKAKLAIEARYVNLASTGRITT
jgi:hypothetical protein